MKIKAISVDVCIDLPKFLVLFASLLFFMLGACRTQEEAELDDSDDTAVLTSEHEVAGDLNPVEAQVFIDDVTIGKSVGSDGMIASDDQGDDFAPGEAVYITMNVSDAPAGSDVKVVWYGPGEARVKEEEKQVPAGNEYLSFSADTASWRKGDYRAEVWVGDEKVNTQQFQIVDPGEMPPEDGPDDPS